MPTYQGQVIEALADGTRRSIFELIGEGPRSVADIAAAMPISRPAVSQHLRVLRQVRLVEVRPEGTRRIYSLDPRGVAAARAYFDRFWTDSLAAYAREVERTRPQREDDQ